jgi:hypothetical protein
MQCQLQISRDTLLMGGHQDKVIEFNLSQGQETNLVCTFPHSSVVAIRQRFDLLFIFSFCSVFS